MMPKNFEKLITNHIILNVIFVTKQFYNDEKIHFYFVISRKDGENKTLEDIILMHAICCDIILYVKKK